MKEPRNPNPPHTKGQLYQEMVQGIEKNGLDYYLRRSNSPDDSGSYDVDPELAAMWRDYVELANKIEAHIGIPW